MRGAVPASRDDPGPPAELRRALADHAIELESRIGAGGSAIVYRGRDRKHDRPVAVKVLRPGLSDPLDLDRFLNEVRVAARLRHRNILPLLDSGRTTDGRVYYIMPLARGETLRARLERGPLALDEALRYARDIAEALAHAHREGVLHGDVKPENILLEAGHAILADFGLARALGYLKEAPGGASVPRLVAGTPAYMSPEQITGDAPADGRSDVYALGVVVHEMLTGRIPFAATTTGESLARRYLRPPEPVSDTRPELPRELDAVLARAMAPEPATRFPTVQALADALDRLRPAGDGAVAPRPVRRWAGASAVLLAGMAIVGSAWWSRASARPTLDPGRVVVADLANETGESRFTHVGQEAGDRITADLVRVPGLDVLNADLVLGAPRRGAATNVALTSPARLRRLADSTRAGTVVSGSYYLEGELLSLFVEVTDARDGHLIGAIGPVNASAARPDSGLAALGGRVVAVIGQLGEGVGEGRVRAGGTVGR